MMGHQQQCRHFNISARNNGLDKTWVIDNQKKEINNSIFHHLNCIVIVVEIHRDKPLHIDI
jgi:hypothetical protein